MTGHRFSAHRPDPVYAVPRYARRPGLYLGSGDDSAADCRDQVEHVEQARAADWRSFVRRLLTGRPVMRGGRRG